MKAHKSRCALLLCAALLLCLALPAFAADDADKTPVFDNVRTDLTISYAGKDSLHEKYVLAFASIPSGDPVGYELYYEDALVGTFTDEEPFVTLASPSGAYSVVAFNRNDPAYRTESGPIHVETEEVTLPVRLRWALTSVYLNVVVYGFLFLNSLAAIPAAIAIPFRQILEAFRSIL